MSNAPRLSLALSAFVVAVDGTLVIGLLGRIAAGVHASPAAAGQAVTVFAIAYAVLAPLIVALTRRWPPQRLLIAALMLFVVANLVTALASSLGVLLAARTIAGVGAGALTPTAAGLATALSSPERRGQALSVVVGGASAAAVVGVPLGTLIGASFGWRVAFFAAAAAGVALLGFLTRTDWGAGGPDIGQSDPVDPSLRRSVLTLVVTLLWASGSFTFFSYLSLVVHRTASAGGSGIAVYLLVFGVAGVIGAVLSGRITDRRGAVVAVAAGLVLVAAALGGFAALVAFGHGRALGVGLTTILIAAYGLGTWAITPAQQHRLISEGGSARVLLSLNASALYAGVAIGAAAGGAVIAKGGGLTKLCALGACLEIGAFLVLTAMTRLVPRGDSHSRP